jgi:hypothetical protein
MPCELRNTKSGVLRLTPRGGICPGLTQTMYTPRRSPLSSGHQCPRPQPRLVLALGCKGFCCSVPSRLQLINSSSSSEAVQVHPGVNFRVTPRLPVSTVCTQDCGILQRNFKMYLHCCADGKLPGLLLTQMDELSQKEKSSFQSQWGV